MRKFSYQNNLNHEKEFHDRWASNIDIDQIDVITCFEGSTSPENRFILSHIGPIQDKYILDLGCGAGENSIYFALKGGRCTASDYSPLMVETALRLAQKNDLSIKGKVMNAEQIEFPDNSFDIVYASNLLHHVNPQNTLQEMHRVLKPGGKACFWDPLKHNPIIQVYRLIAKNVRTEEETPLHIHFLKFVHLLFSDVEYDTFWIISLWIFLHFFLIEKVNPNQERYWKKIITEEKRLRPLYLQLEKYDRLIKKLPFMKRFAWNLAVVAVK